MTLVQTQPLNTNDAPIRLSQNHNNLPGQRRSRLYRDLASCVLSALLAYMGGAGLAAAHDFIEDGQLTVLMQEVK